MSDTAAFAGLWDSFPGGHLRDRAAIISAAIELGLHDEGQGDEAALEPAPLSRASWSMTAACQVTVLRQGYRFAGLVQQAGQGRWGVMGLATPETPTSAEGVEDRAHEILDAHSHQLLGVHEDFGYALMIAERFALRAPVPSEHCDCENVVMSTSARSPYEALR